MLKNFSRVKNLFLFLLSISLFFFYSKEEVSAKNVEITWLGHAAFLIYYPEEKTTILIDPFLKNNPKTPEKWKDFSRYSHIDAILISHSHLDHSSDAIEISKNYNIPIIGNIDYIKTLSLPDSLKKGGNIGGSFRIKNVNIHIVPAMHSSEYGIPVGFILQAESYNTIYHMGDTWIFKDMELIQEIFNPKIILLNVGGGPFTQNPSVAKLAIKKFFKPEYIIPMHYDTFPLISSEESVKKEFEKFTIKTLFLKPGETIKL